MSLSKEVRARIEEKRQAALAIKRKREEEEVKVEDNSLNETVVEVIVDKDDLSKSAHSGVPSCVVSIPSGSNNELSRLCGGRVDKDMYEYYGENVCKSCAQASEHFDQLSKQEVSAQYLLTDSTIRMMKYQEKVNPRNATWSMMKLYLRKHAIKGAIERWGDMASLQAEIDKRSKEKLDKQKEVVNSLFHTEQNSTKSKKASQNKRRKINMAAIVSNMKGEN